METTILIWHLQHQEWHIWFSGITATETLNLTSEHHLPSWIVLLQFRFWKQTNSLILTPCWAAWIKRAVVIIFLLTVCDEGSLTRQHRSLSSAHLRWHTCAKFNLQRTHAFERWQVISLIWHSHIQDVTLSQSDNRKTTMYKVYWFPSTFVFMKHVLFLVTNMFVFRCWCLTDNMSDPSLV